MSGEPRCKKCGKLKLDHNRGFYGRWFCDDEETLFEPAEPSPAPQAERVIEVAPQEEIPECWFDPEYFFNDLETANTKFRILAAALTTARAERDREAEYALKCDQLRWSAEKERDRARDALREMVRSAHPNRKEHPTMYAAWRNAEIVLGELEDDIRALKSVSDRQPEGETK